LLTLVLDNLEIYDSIDKEALASIASTLVNKVAYATSYFAFGSFNTVIRISFEDDSPSWICRLPKKGSLFTDDNEEMLAESLHSTVSTMKYVATHTSIPVPEIYGYCFTSDNIAKTPYVFMEEFHDTVSLADVENELHDDDMERIMYQWAYYTMELAKLQFPKIGMLHLDLDSPNAMESVEIKRFLVPVTVEENAQEVKGYRGPYVSTADYLLGLSDFKKAYYYEAPSYKWEDDPGLRKTLLQGFHTACELESLIPFYLDRRYQNGPFILNHYDFNTQNILLNRSEPGRIVGVIDWDYASILPLQSFFVPPVDLNPNPQGNDVHLTDDKEKFASKWRDVYEKALIAASDYLGFDFPVHELLGSATAYEMLEGSLVCGFDQMYSYQDLYQYVYGANKAPALETSNWTKDFLKKVGMDIEFSESKEDPVMDVKPAPDIQALQQEPNSPPAGKKSLAKRVKAFIRKHCFNSYHPQINKRNL
jgi:aminoglycoside phosphotransferase (APT) family kinase protein